MSDPPEREWRFYVDDMIAFAERAVGYGSAWSIVVSDVPALLVVLRNVRRS